MIIDDIVPETPTELMLMNEINKLKTQLKISEYKSGNYPLANNEFEPLNLESSVRKDVITLPRSAFIISNVDYKGRIIVRLQGKYYHNYFGSEYFIDPFPVKRITEIGNFMQYVHDREMKIIANVIKKNYGDENG